MTAPRVHCHRCTMSFDVRPPTRGVESMRCPDCMRSFWSVVTYGGCRTGVSPEAAGKFDEMPAALHRKRIES
jgi:hypothetical protein